MRSCSCPSAMWGTDEDGIRVLTPTGTNHVALGHRGDSPSVHGGLAAGVPGAPQFENCGC